MNIVLSPSAASAAVGQTSRLAESYRAALPAGKAAPGETVTISQAAQDKLASIQNSDAAPSTGQLQRWRQILVDNVRADPEEARKVADQMAHDQSFELHGPAVNITNYPNLTYSATGEPVTPENLAVFKREAAQVTAGRVALYDQEKAKGTPDAALVEKMLAYTDQQSDNYLSKLGWERATTTLGSSAAGKAPVTTTAPDFSAIKPSELLGVVNDLIKSGRMSLDESSALVPMMPSNLKQVRPGSGDATSDQPINVLQRLQDEISYCKDQHLDVEADYAQKALSAIRIISAEG